MMAGIIIKTPSASSCDSPASSSARLLASRVNPIVLTPWSFPKRDAAAPTRAQVSLRFFAIDLLPTERGAGHRFPFVERMVPTQGAQLLEGRRTVALLGLPLGGELARSNFVERRAHAALQIYVGKAPAARHGAVLARARVKVHLV